MAGDRSKRDGVEAAPQADSGSADHRGDFRNQAIKESFDGVEAAPQADSGSADYWADKA
jgi:hypothetical protein